MDSLNKERTVVRRPYVCNGNPINAKMYFFILNHHPGSDINDYITIHPKVKPVDDKRYFPHYLLHHRPSRWLPGRFTLCICEACLSIGIWLFHDDVIKWKHFPRYWPFVRGIHRSPVPGEFPHKDQWRGALMFSLICVWINGWVNYRKAGDLRRYRIHYDVIVMSTLFVCLSSRLQALFINSKWKQRVLREFLTFKNSTGSCLVVKKVHSKYQVYLYISWCNKQMQKVNKKDKNKNKQKNHPNEICPNGRYQS